MDTRSLSRAESDHVLRTLRIDKIRAELACSEMLRDAEKLIESCERCSLMALKSLLITFSTLLADQCF